MQKADLVELLPGCRCRADSKAGQAQERNQKVAPTETDGSMAHLIIRNNQSGKGGG